MIPFLYKPNNTTFGAGFIGRFDNALSCNVIETLNGEFELHMQILNNDPNLENMAIGSIIVAKPNQTFGNQPFIIEQLVKHIDGTIEVYAVHMSQHRTKLIPVSPFTATDLADTIDKIAANSQETNPFTISTDKTSATSFVLDVPKTLRELMGGSEGSILDIYGGEWLYNNFDLMLMNHRGRTDSNLKVLYGSNMTDYVQTDEFNWSMSYTGILPYYKDDQNLVVGDIQYSDLVDEYPYHKTIAYDFTDRFDSVPTKAQLESKCLAFVNGKGKPHISIEVSFEDLSTLPTYEYLYHNVGNIQLGDTVEIINSAYNTQFRSRVRTLDYDVLLERYNTIKIGDETETINDVISDIGGSEATPGGSVPSLPFYVVNGSTSSSSLPDGTVTQTTLNTVISSNGSGFEFSNGGVKVTDAGKYLICGSNYISANSSSYAFGVYVFKGSAWSGASEVLSLLSPKPSSAFSGTIATGTKVIELNAGDTIFLGARVRGASGTQYPSNAGTYLTILRIV